MPSTRAAFCEDHVIDADVPPDRTRSMLGHLSFGVEGLARATAFYDAARALFLRLAVDAFYSAALEAGGTDAGTPGPRAHYSPSSYAAFVIDPDGCKLEAVHK